MDHCHVTRRVRGVLCRTCNSMIGFAYDNPDLLLGGADYLKKHKNEDPPA